MATRGKGIRSSAQDNFIGPDNVTGVTATDVGTSRAYNNGAITVSWTNPAAGNTPTGYYVYDGATLKATIAHPTSTTTITGLSSNTSYTFTVKSYDSYGTASGASASATATTVPDTPSAPTVSSVSNDSIDVVTWSAPATGGKAITTYYWSSSDGKSGSTSSTSVNVDQEDGTAQTYNVYAANANGNSNTSANSASFTSFSFAPFGFTPFGFTPFGFTPFGFTPFGFTPFGFTPFGFTPFFWLDGGNSLAPEISIAVSNEQSNSTDFVDIGSIQTGNVLSSINFETKEKSNTIVSSVNRFEQDEAMLIDGDVYTLNHKMLVRKDGFELFENVGNIDTTYEKYSTVENDFVSIFSIEKIEIPVFAISIECQPTNNYITNSVVLSD